MRARWRIPVLLVSLVALLPLASATADPSNEPTTVTIVGDLQSELGCPGDWQPECATTHLAYDGEDDVWQGTFSVPAGAWEYKAALDGTWDVNYGANATQDGANIALSLGAPADVKYYYDTETHWITDNITSTIATVPGSYQSHLGCSDWDPSCLASWLQDPDGDGVGTFSTDAIPTGAYEAKVAIDEAWTENYGEGGVAGGPNIAFSVPADGSTTTFTYDFATHLLTIDVAPPYDTVAVVGDLQSELGCPGDWQPECAATELIPGAGDGVYRDTFSVPAGDWNYKAALNDSWDVNYGANATQNGANLALSLGAPTDVKFYYSPDTHWVTDDVNARIVTAAGGFQSELGCPDDWQPDCLLSWLQDIDGDGTYEFTTDAIPAGSYEVKAAIGESWDENYGEGGVPAGPNIAFTTYGRSVTFRFVSATNVLTVDVEDIPGIDNNVHWDELGHDSRDGLYRTPSGPVPAGTDVTLRFRAKSGDLEFATLRVWDDRLDTESLLPMVKVLDDGDHEWWETTLATGTEPTVYWYRFIARDGEAVAYYEDDATRTGGWGEPFGDSQDNSWQLTVHDPGFATPDWVKDAVVYQIFPDRFRDGDPANNTPAGEFFYEENPTVYRSEGTDWNTPICEPRSDVWDWDADAAVDCPVVYSQNFYGGDLQGIIDQLDYLEDLGVTALYMNPIFESPSNHRYDTTDFLQIEDSLGDLETFIALTEAAHARGINVILDGVFNHTSSDSYYFDRYSRYDTVGACESLDSDLRDWYTFIDGDTGPCDDGDSYASWFGFDSLPILESSNQDVRDLIYAGGPDAVARYWLEWADGWRLDVSGDIDQGVTGSPLNSYWEEFRSAVHQTNPDAYIVGEEWGNPSSWILGDEWDATMNYQFSTAVLGFWRDTPFTDNDHNASSSAGIIEPLDPSELWDRLANLQERYPSESLLAMMNLLGSHDTNRALFMLDHNAATGTDDTLLDNPSYDWSDALTRLEGVAILQMTLPGAPTIYYGDEVGLVGPVTYVDNRWEDDPYNRVTYPWLDESGTPFYTHLQSAASQDALRDHYKALTAVRNEHPALRTGSLDLLVADDADGVLAYGRWIDEKRTGVAGSSSASDKADAAIVVINRGSSDQTVALDLAGYLGVNTKLTDVLTGDKFRVGTDGSLGVDVSAGGGAVLVPSHQIKSRPDAVAGLSVTEEAAGSLTLTWPSAGDDVEYDVYRSPLSGGGYEYAGNTADLMWVDTDLTNAVEYHYVVVTRHPETLLESGYSNEASGVPHHDLASGWFDLVWPFSITHTISTETATETVYAQLWLDGFTGGAGPAEGITAELGFGSAGTWDWTGMEYVGSAGFAPNNDEFTGTMLPDQLGTYDYSVRWSSDGGRSWMLSPSTGSMDVVASGDTTVPTAPVLSVTGSSASSVSLEWTVSTDNVTVAGYEVFRDGVEIAEVTGTSFVDTGVTTNISYDYTVRAFDTSWNRSPMSNEVTATAEPVYIDVTFNVTVPGNTPFDVHIAGGFPSPYPFWDPSGLTMTDTGTSVWSLTVTLLEGTEVEYKYVLDDWLYVEKGAACEELGNRQIRAGDEGGHTMTVIDTVANWRNVAPCGS